MRRHRTFALGLGVIGVLGLSAVWGQSGGGSQPSISLDPATITVRVRLGIGDREGQTWSGRVSVNTGYIAGIEGWRFRPGDRITGTESWETRTRQLPGNAKKAAKQADSHQAPGAPVTKVQPAFAPSGVVISLKTTDPTLSIETARGNFTVTLSDLADGRPHRYLEGKADVQRVPPTVPLVREENPQDFPSAATDRLGGVWIAYVDHKPRGKPTLDPIRDRPKQFADYVPKDGGDQVRLVGFVDGRPTPPIDVTVPGLDVWRPAVTFDGKSVVVAWSEFVEGNWDLYARSYDPATKQWTERKRLTTRAGTDCDVVLRNAGDRVWMAWQSWRDGQADIMLAPVNAPGDARNVSNTPANEWSPALAADASGNLHIAYDTYAAGNYDVAVRTRSADGVLGPETKIADSPLFEARPSVAVDPRGRLWVAYEERPEQWGKDSGAHDKGGSSLYRGSSIKVRCLDGRRVLEAPDPLADAPGSLATMNNCPRLACDRQGRIWLAFRNRQEGRSSPVGGTWFGHVTALSGRAWSSPQVLAGSDGMLDNRASLVASEGPVLAVYAGDHRFDVAADRIDPDLRIAALTSGTNEPVEPALTEVPPGRAGSSALVHPNEAADVARVRAHRIEAGGKTYRPLRGEFHRHTEISFDGGNDGALEDMWRYALDCARLDWIGNGDHDNGGHKEYTWWLIQKTTDLYHVPAAFTPMFTYERSVNFPHGHRNVMFPRRGVRTLPRLTLAEGGNHGDDTKMLYDYLVELGGICASHTSATSGMGTDWRDNNPAVEPIVEIYQGIRDSYEHLGAPRVARRESEAVGGFQPYGIIWNALAMQYRLGFQSSSDHVSTHMSYAVALAEEHTRAAILDAFKRRHCYAATDNIVLDVRSGEHLMGDEFEADGPVQVRVRAHGTRPIARVDIIKDFIYVYSTEPKRDRVEFTWIDSERRSPRVSWYYVRLIQDDGELAWCSPMWVHPAGASSAGAQPTSQ